jgi:hypothetical protein
VKLALPIECKIMTCRAIQHWLGMEELVHNMHLEFVELEEINCKLDRPLN